MNASLDHAKHLRVIHFSLVVSSLVVAIASTLDSGDLYDRAYKEALVVGELAQVIGKVAETFDDSVSRAIDNSKHHTAITDFRRNWSDIRFYGTSSNPKYNGRAVFSDQYKKAVLDRSYWSNAIGVFPDSTFVDNHNNHAGNKIGMDTVQSLAHFIIVWDSLDHLSEFYALVGADVTKTEGRRVSDYSEIGSVNDKDKERCDDQFPIQIRISPNSERARDEIVDETGELSPEVEPIAVIEHPSIACRKAKAWTSIHAPPYAIAFRTTGYFSRAASQNVPASTALVPVEVHVPAEHRAVRVLGQETVIGRYEGKYPLIMGDFSESFSALNALMRDLEDVDIGKLGITTGEEQKNSDLVELIEMLKNLTGKQFDLFGVTAPTNIITTWGSVLLAGIMLYLAVHIRAFTRNHAKNVRSELPWIGLYTSDHLARILLIVTAIGLPISVTGWLGWKALPDMSIFALLGYIAVGTTVLIALLLGIAIRDMWRSLPQRKRN